jgi:acyl-lipid omega-6 desaturase (Delta-12 desaturase)
LPKWIAEHVFMNITEHHIHHLDARVPCYKLRECHEAVSEEVWAKAGVHSLGFKEVREALRLALWDEEKERHVPFPPLFDGKLSWGGLVGRLRSVVAGKAA